MTIHSDTCAVDGCERPRKKAYNGKKNGRYRYCSAHQKRKETYGEVYADVPVGPVGGPTSIPELRRRQQQQDDER